MDNLFIMAGAIPSSILIGVYMTIVVITSQFKDPYWVEGLCLSSVWLLSSVLYWTGSSTWRRAVCIICVFLYIGFHLGMSVFWLVWFVRNPNSFFFAKIIGEIAIIGFLFCSKGFNRVLCVKKEGQPLSSIGLICKAHFCNLVYNIFLFSCIMSFAWNTVKDFITEKGICVENGVDCGSIMTVLWSFYIVLFCGIMLLDFYLLLGVVIFLSNNTKRIVNRFAENMEEKVRNTKINTVV